jgi:hypothetical protein
MPGSQTPRGRVCTRADAQTRVAFHLANGVGAPDKFHFVAQWLAYSHPCQRFAPHLAVRHA